MVTKWQQERYEKILNSLPIYWTVRIGGLFRLNTAFFVLFPLKNQNFRLIRGDDFASQMQSTERFFAFPCCKLWLFVSLYTAGFQ